MNVQEIKLKDIKPYGKNPRKMMMQFLTSLKA